MAARTQRLDLRIDIFESTAQRAQVLPTLMPAELIAEILQEFADLEYLGKSANDYVLQKAENHALLDESLALAQQVGQNDHLALADRDVPIPNGTQRPTQNAYLREQNSGHVYRIHWVPAILGRPDRALPDENRLCVNLEIFRTGMRVSRRHAQISQEQDIFYLEGQASNPTLLQRGSQTTAVTVDKVPLLNGDLILFERSNLTLKFIVRP
jgi:hypothetical protein